MDVGAMAMKRYTAFPKAPEAREPHRQVFSCHMQDIHWGVLLPSRGAVSVFNSPNQLGEESLGKYILYVLTQHLHNKQDTAQVQF